jgi:hypothetical protein
LSRTKNVPNPMPNDSVLLATLIVAGDVPTAGLK